MAEEITLIRVVNKIPWGFRLTGGRDFNSPLSVSRITGGSIAEKQGLRVGDLITDIGNEKTTHLTHADAQRHIVEAGNFLKLTVLRGSCPDIKRAVTPIRGMTPVLSVNIEKTKTTSTVSLLSSVNSLCEDDSFEFLDQSDDEYSEEYHEPTEEEIEQMLLENAEIMEEKGKPVLGVNFRRFIPKCEFIKDSAVFQVLQDEQVHKELSEKEQLQKCPNKRFSTFLESPDRPVPMPKCKKDKFEEQMNVNDKDATGNQSSSPISNREQMPKITCCQADCDKNKECRCKCTAETIDRIKESENILEQTHKDQIHTEMVVSVSDGVQVQELTESRCGNSNESEEANDFEKQLNDIKDTLSALGALPSLIQSQLATIQSQINELLKLKEGQTTQIEESVEKSHQKNEQESENEDILYVEQSAEHQNDPVIEEYDEQLENEEESNYDEESICEQTENEEQSETKQANVEHKNDVKNEKLECGRNTEEQNLHKRRICPLTPLPRPVVLPGGRIWRKPKDAYNEEFIAETLISQAEVLVGSTLGVNFRKYEPPKFDVTNSAVYKLIHNIESKNVGLVERDTVPALQDYYQSPISAKHFYLASLADKVNKVSN